MLARWFILSLSAGADCARREAPASFLTLSSQLFGKVHFLNSSVTILDDKPEYLTDCYCFVKAHKCTWDYGAAEHRFLHEPVQSLRLSFFFFFNHSAIYNWKMCLYCSRVAFTLASVYGTYWSLANRADGFRETVAKLGDPPRVYRSIPHSTIGKCKILHNLHFNTSWRTQAH